MPDKDKFSMVPIQRTDVFQNIIQQITALLESGNLVAGDRLPSERELAETLGVSRTSIRQALKVLEASGRIETRVGSGTYLLDTAPGAGHGAPTAVWQPALPVTGEFLRQLIVARTAIERAIFEEYAWRANKSGIRQLRELIEENAAELVNDEADDERGGLDLSFETKVAELTGNVILMTLQQQIHQLWVSTWSQYGYVPEKKSVLHREHLAILDALAARNTARVVDLIVQHVDKEIE